MKRKIGLIGVLAGALAIGSTPVHASDRIGDVIVYENGSKPVANSQAGRNLRHFRQRYYVARPQEPKNQQQRREHWRRCPQCRPKKARR